MAAKKTKKRTARNTTAMQKTADMKMCGCHTCKCGSWMAILIIILLWISTATWSKVVITILAAMIAFHNFKNPCCRKGM